MADKEVTALAAAGALAGTEVVHIVQGGNSRQESLQDIADLATIEVEEEGVSVATDVIRLNFIGGGATAADVGGGEVSVTIPGDSGLNFREVTASGNLTSADFAGGRIIITNTVSDITLTVVSGLSPTHSCTIFRKGAGEVTVTNGGGVTLLSEGSNERIDLVNTAVTVAPTDTSEEYFMAGKIKA